MSETKKQNEKMTPDKDVRENGSTATSNVAEVEIEDYKKIRDYSKEELLELGQATVTLRTLVNKKTNTVRYTLTIDLKNQMQFIKNLTKNEYLTILLQRKLDQQVLVHSFVCPIRFIIGENKTFDGNWIKYEVVIVKNVIIDDFLNKADVTCVQLMGDYFGYELIKSSVKEDRIKVNEDFYI